MPLGDHVLANIGPDEPFGGGEPPDDFDLADPASTGQIMAFHVVPRKGPDRTTPPRRLRLPPIESLGAGNRRSLALVEEMSASFEDAPAAAMLGTVSGDPSDGATWRPLMWSDEITENPSVGDTEVWEFFNATADAHPIHIHEVLFQVVDRQAITVDEEERSVRLVPDSVRAPATAMPAEVTRVKLRFDQPGQFVWHCHIVSTRTTR